MKSEPFVKTELHTKASAQLEKEIQDELMEEDPDVERAKAALDENEESANADSVGDEDDDEDKEEEEC